MKPLEVFKNSSYSCVMSNNNSIVCALSGIGVKPLISTYTNYPNMMSGAVIADKVIGKAAAMIAVAGGAAYVYGEVMSESGFEYLTKHNISASYGTLVPGILNRTKDGSCPIEASVIDISDSDEGIKAIRATIAVLMARK